MRSAKVVLTILILLQIPYPVQQPKVVTHFPLFGAHERRFEGVSPLWVSRIRRSLAVHRMPSIPDAAH